MQKITPKVKNKNIFTSKFYGRSSYVKMIDSYYSNKEINKQVNLLPLKRIW